MDLRLKMTYKLMCLGELNCSSYIEQNGLEESAPFCDPLSESRFFSYMFNISAERGEIVTIIQREMG